MSVLISFIPSPSTISPCRQHVKSISSSVIRSLRNYHCHHPSSIGPLHLQNSIQINNPIPSIVRPNLKKNIHSRNYRVKFSSFTQIILRKSPEHLISRNNNRISRHYNVGNQHFGIIDVASRSFSSSSTKENDNNDFFQGRDEEIVVAILGCVVSIHLKNIFYMGRHYLLAICPLMKLTNTFFL